jgi:outer membrane protein OmpA-like peptidoglycan-associated protein
MSEEKPPIESQFAADPVDHATPPAGTAAKSSLPPAVALAFVIIALLGVLIVMNLRGGFGRMVSGSPEITELQAEANALKSQLNRERVAMGLRPLEGNFEPVEDVAARLKKDAETMVALAASYQAMLADKDTELSAKSAELLRAEQLRQTYASESARLQGELQRALVGSSQADGLRRDLELMRSQRDALSAELATKGKGVPEDEYEDLKRRFEETLRAKEFFEAKVTELESELSKAKLFASSENELLPAAVELFRSLRQLENKPDSEIAAEYSSLGVKLGANALFKLNFATGSSELAPADQELIRNLVADIPDGDLVLAIGYASETGNVDNNRTLSSDRATAAATLFSSVKRPAQLVQAVYLGQTDRFSSRIPERNQIVEIWRIRKK